LGSIITLNAGITGLITFVASLFMILIGVQLLQLFPSLSRFSISLPKTWIEKISSTPDSSKKASWWSAFLLGAATFFLPCGFTQAMQLFVLGVGNALFGAVALFVFALGTLPSFLSIGVLTSFLKKGWMSKLSVASGVLVIMLGLLLLPSGLTLMGFQTPDLGSENIAQSSLADVSQSASGEFQEVKMSVVGLSYSPHQFTVKKGIPVKWVIDGTQARGCGQILTMPKEDIFVRLDSYQQTVIEFTPSQTGDLPFHCSMAMTTPNAKFIVVD